jgi:hypothetical protein
VYWFLPNGLLPDKTRPTTEGADYDLPPVLSELAPVKDRVSVITGLENRAARAPGSAYSSHERAMMSVLTDEYLDTGFLEELKGGLSVDQYAARIIGQATPFKSLVLGTPETSLAGIGNLGIYYSTLSWAGPKQPIPPIASPRSLFERMFAGSDPTVTAQELALRKELRKSVLDAVRERTTRLESRLDAGDRAKLDQFTTGVRELELRIDQLAEASCPPIDTPPANLDLPEMVTAFHDLLVLALQCDQTRVASFMLGPTVSTMSYPFLGVSSDHHSLSHGFRYSETDLADLLRIQGWAIGQWGSLAAKLAAIPEDGGDMLSNTMMMLVTEFADSNDHVASPQSVLVAGGEAGGVVQGRHRVYEGRPHVDLLAATLEFAGVDSTGFGTNQTGPIDLSAG